MRTLTSVSGCLLVAVLASHAAAAQLTSADFSFAYGFGRDPEGAWGTSENTATNSPVTQGDFTLSPAPASPLWSTEGPVFTDRTLGNENGTSQYSTWVGNSISDHFTVPITASYTGPAPVDAAAVPNYRLLIEITSISIYGAVYPGSSATSLEWDETTAGHEQTSPSISPAASSAWTQASSYQQLTWNPDDFSLAIAALGDSATRTFGILPLDANDARYLDGLEISGRVHLVYDVVPEPGALSMLALAAIPLCRRRARASHG